MTSAVWGRRGTLSVVDLVGAAAQNNADWCAVVCAAHGLRSTFDTDAWVSERRSPPMYPDAVTLVPEVAGDGLLTRIEAGPGCSVKDSYADLDLRSAGFEVLFEANWICRTADVAGVPTGIDWAAVTTAAQLAEWAAAHGGGDVFTSRLLDDPAVTVLAGQKAGAIVAGVVVNVSTAAHWTAQVVGVSNLFAVRGEDDGDVWAGATAAVTALHPGVLVVGYESGPSLAAAEWVGFERVGALRVWYAP